MKETRYCRQCHAPFEAKRDDHRFCCAAHVAAWYRDNPNPDYIHAEKEHIHAHYCEHCGVPYNVNDYAQRGGQRVPKYCSPKCKQAAYRARGKANQQQAERRHSGGAKQQQKPPPNHKQRKASGSGQSEFWAGYASRWAAAEAILGIKSGASAKEVRAGWMRQLKIWHPDINKSPEAVVMTQKINWAYEYLSK